MRIWYTLLFVLLVAFNVVRCEAQTVPQTETDELAAVSNGQPDKLDQLLTQHPGDVATFGPLLVTNVAEGPPAQEIAVLRTLMKHGVKIDARNPNNGWTPLECVLGAPHQMDVIKFLLKSGANINVVDAEVGETPVTHAITALETTGHDGLGYLELLLQKGAKVNIQPSPLERAVAVNQPGAVTLLLKYGVKVDSGDGPTMTSLILAATDGDLAIVKILAAHGADVNHTTSLRQTALSAAHDHGHRDVEVFLRQHGAR